MKKIYTLIASLCFGFGLNAQDAFWTPTNYKGAFPVTDNTPATDWTAGWSNFDPDTINYSTNYTSTVSTDITSNVTWSGVILLQNKIYVKNNATLTIQPGTIIRGDKATQGSLIVTRGAKLNAIGTSSQPIVFTSNQTAGVRKPGDWGGVVILGLARNNQPGGVANIEGIPPITDTQYGGSFDNDNSGTIKYVRIEFAGIPLAQDKEINGITFGSVGSGTTVDYVQVTMCGDDSFEWFGGTVNCKHLISYRAVDDDFDTDFGYRGKVQFGLIIRDKSLSDAAGDSNGFESDNDAAGSVAQPKTRPIFSNITLVGAKGNGTITLPPGEKHERAFRLRRNTATSVFNSIATGFERGLFIEGAATLDNVTGDTLVFANNILTNFATPVQIGVGTNSVPCPCATSAWYQSWWGVDNNDSTSTLDEQVKWVNIFTAMGETPDARLGNGSVAASGANFTDPKFFSVVAPTVATTSFTYCQGATATQLTATASNGNTLAWYEAAKGGTSLSGAPTLSTTTAGIYTYYVSQKNANGDESPRVAITITVNALPSVPTITANGATSFCTGGSVELTSSSATGNTWSTSATTQSITVTSSGSYTVTVKDNNNCSATSIATIVNVSNSPTPTVAATATEACSGDTIKITSSAADSYVWSNGATTQSIEVTSSGTYSVVTTNSDACKGVGTSNLVNVNFTKTPVAAGSFTVNGNVVTFTNNSTGASSYSWDFGDFTNSSASAPVHAYAVNGDYQVVLTAINANCKDTASLNVSIALSVEELMGIRNLIIYPNPASDEIHVSFENQNGNALYIEMVDQLGRVVYSENEIQQIGFNKIGLNLSQISDGLYSVFLRSGNNTIAKRIIVKK
jgi:hypothetical protein